MTMRDKIRTGHPDPTRPFPLTGVETVSTVFQTRLVTPAAILLLFVMGVSCLLSLRLKSPTVDEFAHLPAGYYYWMTADFSLYDKNPPLMRLLCALPLLGKTVTIDGYQEHQGGGAWRPWVFGTHFMRQNARDYDHLFFLGRIPVIMLALVLGLFVFRWARELFGPFGGLLSLAFYSFCPNVLAHARLVTTDLGLTCFMFLTIYYAWRCFHKGDRKAWVGAGLFFGLSLLTKFTALILFPVLALLGLWSARPARTVVIPVDAPAGALPPPHASLRGNATRLVLVFLLALFMVNLGYGFQGSLRSLKDIPHESRFLALMARTPLEDIPLPVPAPYVRGFDSQKVDAEQGEFLNYLRGKLSNTGWWYYFIYAFGVKTTLSTLAALTLSLWLGLGMRKEDKGLAYLVVPVVSLVTAMSLFNELNVGLRYILPVFPFLFVGFGSLARWLSQNRPFSRGLTAVLVVTHVVASVLIFPNYLAYFNPLAGGPERGHRHLLDSNLDWGQDLKQLKRYLEKEGISEVGLAYFGHIDPAIYGIAYHMLPDGNGPLRKGPIAISANYLFGLPYVATYTSPPKTIRPGMFSWLRDHEPTACIGYSIYVFAPTPAENPPLPR